jgi:hypothetical protein
MRDRDPSKIGKAKQCLVRRFAHLSDSLQASREQHVLYTRWESNLTGWCLIRKLWRWLKLAHFFTFQPANPAGFLGNENVLWDSYRNLTSLAAGGAAASAVGDASPIGGPY